MGHGNDHDVILISALEHVEGKSPKNELTRAVVCQREALRSFSDSGNGIVNGVSECGSTQWTSLVVPLTRITKFRASLRVKPDSHSDWPNNSARTSSHGINSTVPASTSANRRLISSDQAASTSGSETGSSVSMSNPAKVARSRSGIVLPLERLL